MAAAPTLDPGPPQLSSGNYENEKLNSMPDADLLPTNTDNSPSDALSQENLLQKLGLGSVQHIALQSQKIQDACMESESTKPDATEEPDCVNDDEGVPVPCSDPSSTQESRSTTPLAQLNGNVDAHSMTKKAKRVSSQRLKVESLKDELQCEEAKLLLLKKILESQTSKRSSSSLKSRDNVHGRNVHPSLHSKYAKPNTDAGKIQIAPKVVLSQKGSNMPRVVPSIVSASNSKSAVQGQVFSSGNNKLGNIGSTSTSQSGNSSVRKYYIQVGSQLVPATPSSSVYSPSTHYNSSSAHIHTPAIPSQRRTESPVDSQVNKQTIAKNALRRQLEQTLLQIPPPKPPPADWNTIPNVNSMDFMMLVGLDEIVDMILELDDKPTMKAALLELIPPNPRICDQCRVDFSPSWKPKPGGPSGVMLCERCAVTNVKKELKAEHTSRLKSAFIKALKQEQDIEEKIKAGEDVSYAVPDRAGASGHPSGSSHAQSQGSHGHQHSHQPSSQQDRHRQAVHRHHHQVVPHYPRHTSLVHQLHQQHLQQQPQGEAEPTSSHHGSSPRWHPYIAGGASSSQNHHERVHTPGGSHAQPQQQGRRNYGTSANGGHEYYVVHHPQHSNVRWSSR